MAVLCFHLSSPSMFAPTADAAAFNLHCHDRPSAQPPLPTSEFRLQQFRGESLFNLPPSAVPTSEAEGTTTTQYARRQQAKDSAIASRSIGIAENQHPENSPDMSGRRRSVGGDGTPSPFPGAGGSGTAPDLRPIAEVVPRSAGGFEVKPSDYILQVSRKAFQSRMDGCWPRWDDIPPHVKNAIQADLLAAVRVDPDDVDVFLNRWKKRMRKNYRDTLSKAKNLGKKPNWMGEGVWNDFLRLWDSPAAKELSARNRANRNKNPALHRGGSKSFQEHKRELAARYNREPTMAELFKATHAVERTDEEGNVSYEWTDDKSQSVMERYEEERARVAQSTGREELTLEEENHIWNAIIDPPSRTSRRYSYGNVEAMRMQSAYRRSQQEAEIAQLRATVEEINDWRKSFFEQQLDERIAAYLQQHGRMPGEDDSDDEE